MLDILTYSTSTDSTSSYIYIYIYAHFFEELTSTSLVWSTKNGVHAVRSVQDHFFFIRPSSPLRARLRWLRARWQRDSTGTALCGWIPHSSWSSLQGKRYIQSPRRRCCRSLSGQKIYDVELI